MTVENPLNTQSQELLNETVESIKKREMEVKWKG